MQEQPPSTAAITPAAFDTARQHFVEGISHYEAARYLEAQTSFATCLLLLPGRVSALGNLGATLIKLGQPAAALTVLDQALATDPDYLDACIHRGMALADLSRPVEALACQDAALRLNAQSIPAWYQRSLMLNALGRHQEALDSTEHLLALDADNAEAWWARAEALHRLERHDAALAAFDQLLAINPQLPKAWSQRAGVLKDLGRHTEALAAFEQALALGGDAELNGYFIASLTGQSPPSAPPRLYVETLFDGYAEQFDTHLVKVLGYQAHTVLVENLQGLGKTYYRSALDLGCGTGLCGPLVRARTDHLEGVDLSRLMLDKARTASTYDTLVQADVSEHLQTTARHHDLVLSADVFIYVGALEGVFAGVARVLLPGGVFCFSVESTDDAHDYRLMPSQRYAHSERYLRMLAANHGMTVVKTLAHPVRQDQQRSIDGLYVYLVKS